MLKILKALCFILIVSSHSLAQDKTNGRYSLTGHIENWNGRLIYFSCKGTGFNRVWDSAVVKNNTFTFTGILNEPSIGFITTLQFNRIKNLEAKNITDRLFVSPSVMTISLQPDNFHGAILKGSKYHTQYLDLEASKKELYSRLGILSKLYDSLDKNYDRLLEIVQSTPSELNSAERKRDSAHALIERLYEDFSEIDKLFFKKNPNSYITTFLLENYYGSMTLNELNFYYSRMSAQTKGWVYGIKLKEAIRKLQMGSPGSVAADFNEADVNGESISLSQFRGKYVLLDFWASWCKPCRAGNPELIQLYNKYKDEGIEFIGIADDNGKEGKWRNAIEEDKINIWRHILDKKTGDQYAVHSIPLQILINKKGEIIGRFGAGGEPIENLAKRLAVLFGY